MKRKKGVCKFCKADSIELYAGYCQRCYHYFHNGGKVYPLPSLGEITYSEKGFPVCHICGQAYSKLGMHIYYAHKITTKEYKDMFELCYNSRLTSAEYSEKMSKLAYENGMDLNLKVWGLNTRLTSENIPEKRRFCLQNRNIIKTKCLLKTRTHKDKLSDDNKIKRKVKKMKKVIWENISGTFDSECYQSVVKTDKSLIVDNGKSKIYYKVQDVNSAINNYNNSTEYDKLDRLFRDLQAYKPYKKGR